MSQTVEFKAEVKQILDLVVHSLYSHKEIFLRELISNASDAIDKAKYLSLTDEKILEGGGEFRIKLIADKEAGTLTISDNGIGMTQEEAIEALGTIAHSGTKKFMAALQSEEVKENPELIGQFGVGFYSSFMVADKVKVVTRKAGTEVATQWESEADGTYTIEAVEKEERGTDITLYLKEDEKNYAEEWEIKGVVKKYSDYIEHPVVMDIERSKPDEEDESKTVTTIEEETLNSMTAVWLKDKSEVTEEEYNEFYKHISHDFVNPAEVIHFRAEGTSEFTSLLYIPSKSPMDILYKEYKSGPALYVKKVQIMDHCEDLLPMYLRFVKGVVDSSDLPLNVSRELLQNNKQIEVINKNLTKKILGTLKTMKKKDMDKYKAFHQEFGRVLKEGIHYDMSRKEEIASLLIFPSTKSEGELIDLETYVKNMPEGQEEIYYITGKNMKEVESSPYLEALNAKGYEVLYMLDEIDDIIMSSLMEFDKKKVRSIIKGDIDLGDDENKEEKEKKEEEYKDLLGTMNDSLGDKVTDVKLSGRLTDSACCLVSSEGDLDPQMAKMMEAMGQPVPAPKRVLEVNPDHDLFKKMQSLFEVDQKSSVISDYSQLLYDLSMVMEGNQPEDTGQFSKLITQLMTKSV